MIKRVASLLILCAMALPGVAAADALDDIAARGTVNIGYRTDAPPFSFLDDTKHAAGFAVDLCLRIVDAAGKTVNKPLTPAYVAVTPNDQFTALQSGKIDLLCGPTTITFGRRELVDFSLITFASGGTLMTKAPTPTLPSGSTLKVAVLAHTTSEATLRRLVAEGKIKADISTVDTHDVAVGLVLSGKIDGYFADRELLWDRLAHAPNPDALQISDVLMSYEPYAIAMRLGEERLRLISDRALADMFRTLEIAKVFTRWFPHAAPSEVLKALYFTQAFEDEAAEKAADAAAAAAKK